VHLRDDPDHRVVDVARRQERVAVVHRQRGERDQRDPEVDDRDGRRAGPHEPLERPTLQFDLARQPGRRLEAGERDRRDRQREHEVRPLRRAAQVNRVEQRVRVEEQHQPEHDDQQLQREVADDERGHSPRALPAEAADVAEHDERDEHERQRERLAAMPEGAPEHARIVGRRVARDGDQDDVVEQDRPACDEADQLVERVAREHRRAAALRVHRRALGVRHRRQGEQHRADEEDDRRQTERVAGDDAEREVDRSRDRRVDDREQRRRADAASHR